jgi:hypothetical protein
MSPQAQRNEAVGRVHSLGGSSKIRAGIQPLISKMDKASDAAFGSKRDSQDVKIRSVSRVTPLEIAFFLLTPVFAVFLFDISLINQDNYVDPWFYTGYGRIFPSMHALFGWTYYSARFPVMILNGAFLKFPDPIVGYIALRYLLLLLCGIPLYLWARRFFGDAIAIASYLFLFCNPLFPRVVLWDLTTFVSIPFALAGMALWLLPMRSLALNRVLTGFLFCASIGAHAFTGTAIGTFLITEALRRLIHKDLRKLILYDVLATGFGAVLCFGIGILYYYFNIGSFNPMVIISITANAARQGDQYAITHASASLGWLGTQYHVYVPYLLILVAGAGLSRKLLSNEIAARVWIFSATYGAAFAIYQFIFGSFVLETFYYFAHLTLIVYLLFPVCLFLILRSAPPWQQQWAAAIAVLMLVALPTLTRFVPSFIDTAQTAALGSLGIAGLMVAFCILCAGLTWVATQRPTFAMLAVASLVTMVQLAPMITWEHRAIYANPRKAAKELGVYRAALEMLDVFSAYAQPTTRVMLWYPASEFSLGSIASTVLLFTVHQPYEGQGMPSFGDYERERLRYPGLRYIMLLSQRPGAVAEGLAALTHEGLILRDVTRRAIGAEGFSADLVLVEIGQNAETGPRR